MNGDVEALAGFRRDIEEQRRARGFKRGRQGVADRVGELAADDGFEIDAVDLAAMTQHFAGIGGMAQDLRCLHVAGEQAAMGLHAAGDVDRLAVAVGQVKGLFRRHVRCP